MSTSPPAKKQKLNNHEIKKYNTDCFNMSNTNNSNVSTSR